MNTSQRKNSGLSKEAKVGLGLGLAAAAAAGAYFLYSSKEGPKRRQQIRGWALKAKGEVLEKLEQAKEVNEDVYHRIVDRVVERYQKLKGVDTTELVALAADLKRHWNNISRQISAAPKTKKRSTTRTKKKTISSE